MTSHYWDIPGGEKEAEPMLQSARITGRAEMLAGASNSQTPATGIPRGAQTVLRGPRA